MLRRRKAQLQHEEDDLSRRLLAGEDSAEAECSAHAALIVYSPFSLEGFLRYVLRQCQYIATAINRFLAYLSGGAPAVLALSAVQQQRLEALQRQLQVKFDVQLQEHQQGLRQLWQLAFPGVPFEGLCCERWKDMGWQNRDPSTDFRGAGLFGLQCLLHLGSSHHQLFDRLLHKRDGMRADWEYPFAVAGLNVTFQLAQLLELQQPGKLPRSAAGRAFLVLLEEHEHAFEEVYCLVYGLLDQLWLAAGASYMQFNAVLKDACARLAAALEAQPGSMAELRRHLGQ